ncbi:MAG TPA: aldehyde dehydrogenase family protein [Acidimicrobiales bacterium]|jgi:acyl-CoA reductase-like NAD-dependent aldehyde dehydrogenase|nr:aldehyde dehydrogenase family protein [Acidimicrobiales bacterium]
MTDTAERTIQTSDPRTGAVTGSVPNQGPDEVAAAIARARVASVAWAGLTFEERATHLKAVRDLLLDRAEQLVDVVCAETGKLRGEAVFTELMVACELIDYYAKHGGRTLQPEKVSAGSTMVHKKAMRWYEPMGVVGVISPWNYPLTLTMTPVATALFAGNTVVLKPSEVTPLVGVEVGKLFAEVGGHPDIVQVVTGDGMTGDAVVRGGVDMVCFTGSVATGRKVAVAAAEQLIPVILELGGKDPMIVCDDADLDRAAAGALWGAFSNSGQTCMAVERVYVQDSVYDQFVDKVVDGASKIRQGEGPAHDIGSMTFPKQVDIVERHVDEAVDKGAKALVGGHRVLGKPGLWFEPTVLVDVDHDMAVMRDETFGPVLPIMRFHDDKEAIALANDSVYGLNSSVWTKSPERGEQLAARIQAGNVCVNDALVSYGVTSLPFGGVKESGIGRVHGEEALRRFSIEKSVLVDRAGLKKEVYWFPLPKRIDRMGLKLLRARYRSGAGKKLKALLPSRNPR